MTQQLLKRKDDQRLASTLDFKIDTKALFIPEGAPDKLNVTFTYAAWQKMWALVKECESEIGWHGTVVRDSVDSFTVTDIILYKQEVTGATVQSIEPDYTHWLIAQPDEIFNHLRLQGHSHVRMACSPSGVDQAQMDGILSQAPEFYIFMILNKHESHWIEIHLPEFNCVYEKEDVILHAPTYMGWAKQAISDFVVKKTYAVTSGNITYQQTTPGLQSPNTPPIKRTIIPQKELGPTAIELMLIPKGQRDEVMHMTKYYNRADIPHGYAQYATREDDGTHLVFIPKNKRRANLTTQGGGIYD